MGVRISIIRLRDLPSAHGCSWMIYTHAKKVLLPV